MLVRPDVLARSGVLARPDALARPDVLARPGVLARPSVLVRICSDTSFRWIQRNDRNGEYPKAWDLSTAQLDPTGS